jgi:type I restriction enzyme S subunit
MSGDRAELHRAIDDVPVDWSEVAVADVVAMLPGFAFKSENFVTDTDEGLPLIRIRDLGQATTISRYVGGYDEGFAVQDGDILVGMDGEFAAVRWRGGKALLNQRVLKLSTARTDAMDEGYLFYRVQPALLELEQTISGTTVKHLSTKDLRRLTWQLPPLDEQRRIAEVLRSVDQTIAADAAVVANARALLANMGREVLHSADQEPTQGERRFALLDICRPKQHPIIGKADLTESGYPVYGANGQIGYCHSYTHAQPVIAITCRGATCGTVNWVPAKSYVTGNAMALDQIDRKRIDERFLFHYVSTWGVDRSISGSAQPQITRQSLTCIDIIAPDLDRQREIADALDSIEDQARAASTTLEATKSVKAALMSDLLSGRVRVPA